MKRLLALLVALFILPIVFADAPVPVSTETYTTTATLLGGSGSPPEFENWWVLPDEMGAVQVTSPTNGIPVLPIATPGTQVFPWAEAERTDIYACIVVNDTNGRDDTQDVWVDLFHPYNMYTTESDTLKYQVHATKLDNVGDISEIMDCLDGALINDLIDIAEYERLMYVILDQPIAYMYKVYLPMLYHQPAGWYRGELHATDTNGNTGTEIDSQFFEWVPTVILATDIGSTLDFGEIQKGVAKYIQGDYNFGVNGPTVKNQGNVPIELSVENTKMVGQNLGKFIEDFDVQFRAEHVEYPAETEIILSKALRNCHTEKIDFSVHPDNTIPIDDYSGSLILGAADGSFIYEESPADIFTAPDYPHPAASATQILGP